MPFLHFLFSDLYIQLLPINGIWAGPGIDEKLLIADSAADFVTEFAIMNFQNFFV